jgi:hypothetical protein
MSRFNVGETDDSESVHGPNRLFIYGAMLAFVGVGMVTGVLARERPVDPENVAIVAGANLVLVGCWFAAYRHVRRGGCLIGMDAAQWVVGPALAYLGSGLAGFVWLGGPPGLR